MYHQARTWSSPLTASRKPSSLRLPRVGARTLASAIASRGGLRLAPSGPGAGIFSSPAFSSLLIAAIVGMAPGETKRSAADRPGAGARARVQQRRAVVLLGFGGRRRVAVAADRFPGAVVELVFAAVAAVGGDRRRVAAGLAGGDRFERPDRDPPGRSANASRCSRASRFTSARCLAAISATATSIERCRLRPGPASGERAGVASAIPVDPEPAPAPEEASATAGKAQRARTRPRKYVRFVSKRITVAVKTVLHVCACITESLSGDDCLHRVRANDLTPAPRLSRPAGTDRDGQRLPRRGRAQHRRRRPAFDRGGAVLHADGLRLFAGRGARRSSRALRARRSRRRTRWSTASPSGRRKRVAMMVSREDHCLSDLLWRWRNGELGGELVAVVSNHPDHADAGRGGRPPLPPRRGRRRTAGGGGGAGAGAARRGRPAGPRPLHADPLRRLPRARSGRRRSTSTTASCPPSSAPTPTAAPTSAG